MTCSDQVVLVIKNLFVNAGDIRDPDSIPGSGRTPGGGHGNPLQYSCLKNPVDRGDCQVASRSVTQSWTRLKQLRMHACSNHKLWTVEWSEFRTELLRSNVCFSYLVSPKILLSFCPFPFLKKTFFFFFFFNFILFLNFT